MLRRAQINNTLNMVALMTLASRSTARQDIRGTQGRGGCRRGHQGDEVDVSVRGQGKTQSGSKLREVVYKGSSGAPSPVETEVSKGAALEVTWGPTRPGGMSPASA